MTPIILDTDIGTDVDDAYALVLAATAPELSLCAVTTVNNDVRVRGLIAGTLLRYLGNPTPVARGESNRLDGSPPPGWRGHESAGMELDPSVEFDTRSASDLIRDCVISGRCR